MSETPNVVVSNPHVRKVMTWVLGVAMIVLPCFAIVEAQSSLVFGPWLVPATGVVAFLGGIFNVTVVSPNIPKSGGKYAAE